MFWLRILKNLEASKNVNLTLNFNLSPNLGNPGVNYLLNIHSTGKYHEEFEEIKEPTNALT